MLGCFRDIFISTPQDTPHFQQLLGDGSQWGMDVPYAVQPSPGSLAQAFIIGDDIFYGHDFEQLLSHAYESNVGATVFAYRVQDPKRYGVVVFHAVSKATASRTSRSNPRAAMHGYTPARTRACSRQASSLPRANTGRA